MIYSYVRVSTEQQSLERQIMAINDFCLEKNVKVDEMFQDKISGKTFNRENYLLMKSKVKSGDFIIIKELDRLGRDWDLIKEEWEWFQNNGIRIIITDMPLLSARLDNKTETLDNRLISSIVFNLLCYMAQKEREKISRRTKEALQAKKKNGVVLGRPKAFSECEIPDVIRMYKDRTISIQEICDKYDISKPTLIAEMKKQGVSRYKKNE